MHVYDDPLDVVKWKFTYINMKYDVLLLHQNLFYIWRNILTVQITEM